MIRAAADMDLICPMHARLDANGIIRHAGPTLQKLRPGQDVRGMQFLDLFEVLRPRLAQSPELRDLTKSRLRLRFRSDPQTALRGLCLAEPGEAGCFINLSFGISVFEAVQDYALSSTDFSPTDPTVEMLYLHEAKTIAMQASSRLNHRLQEARLMAEDAAATDPLTGLRNRRGLTRFLDHLAETGRSFAVMHADLDGLKSVNDTMGHAAGDQLICRAADAMREVTREGDIVARIGGDEFVMALPGLQTVKKVDQFMPRFFQALDAPVDIAGRMMGVRCSVGVALSRDLPTGDIDGLLEAADAALYRSKAAGGQTYMVHYTGQDLAGSSGMGTLGSA